MTSFVLTASTTAGNYVLNAGESGYVPKNIFATVTTGTTSGNPVVVLNASASLTVLGSIYTSGPGTAVVTGFSTLTLYVGEEGSVLGAGTGISMGNLALTNLGSINAPVAISLSGSSTSTITNLGDIGSPGGTGFFSGVFAINHSGSGQLIFDNQGLIAGGMTGPAGGLLLYNAGVVDGVVNTTIGSTAFDRIYNTGTIAGSIVLGGGGDFYDGRGGTSRSGVFGEAGNDTLFGGFGGDLLLGGSDNDTLYFDSEDLRFGLVLGGTGYDTGYNMDETTPLTINMQAQELEGYFGSAADETVVAGNLGGFGLFASTGAGNDLIEGTSVGDNINGGSGVDVLYGRGGLDDLAGGLGGDWVQGGAGADTFRYNALTDSTVNGQDFIADFSTAEGDKINLTQALAGLPAATFNTGFGVGTSVYVFAGGGGTSLVQAYTASTLQMQIVVSQASLAVSDFVF